MLLESIEVQNFRNLFGGMACGGGLNILIGDNGEGKTNWLEAIYLLATTRSFKTAKLQEAIRFGENMALVHGMVRESPEITRKLQVAIEGKTKSLAINDKKETLHGYLGQLHAIVFNSDELEMVRGLPEASGLSVKVVAMEEVFLMRRVCSMRMRPTAVYPNPLCAS